MRVAASLSQRWRHVWKLLHNENECYAFGHLSTADTLKQACKRAMFEITCYVSAPHLMKNASGSFIVEFSIFPFVKFQCFYVGQVVIACEEGIDGQTFPCTSLGDTNYAFPW